MTTYLKRAINPSFAKQTEPLARENQVQNSAGGFVYAVDNFTALNRFLFLGSEGGSYYASERQLTIANLDRVKAAIKEDGARAVRTIVEVSDAGRAPKNSPALMALALCACADELDTRTDAYAAIPKVARTGTHLFEFTDYVEQTRGWGRGIKRAVGNWYLEKSAESLAFQSIKYKQRGGVSHADVLRRAHPKTADASRNAILSYMVDGWPSVGETPHPDTNLQVIWAAERAATDISDKELVRLITEYRLPMESIPTEKRSKSVYEAMLPHSGLTWLIRNLGNLAKSGVIAEGQYSNLNTVCERITDAEAIKKGRVHPLSLLLAHVTYTQGKGVRGRGEWPVIQKVADALEAAFYVAFDAIEPTGKRHVLGLDVSGSMSMGEIAGLPGITPRGGSVAMAMTTYRTEPNTILMAFCDEFVPFNISKYESLTSIAQKTNNLTFGRTDCARPMLWAMKNRVEADAFVIYTDSETWYGDIHPMVALRQYRQLTGINARLIVVGMVSNEFTIADPNDAGAMDVVGFDTAAPAVMSEFIAGNI